MREIIIKAENIDVIMTKNLSGYKNMVETVLIEIVPEKIINSPPHGTYEILKTKKENGKKIIKKDISVKSVSSSVKDGFDVLINVKNLSNLELAFLLQSEDTTISFEKGK